MIKVVIRKSRYEPQMAAMGAAQSRVFEFFDDGVRIGAIALNSKASATFSAGLVAGGFEIIDLTADVQAEDTLVEPL